MVQQASTINLILILVSPSYFIQRIRENKNRRKRALNGVMKYPRVKEIRKDYLGLLYLPVLGL